MTPWAETYPIQGSPAAGSDTLAPGLYLVESILGSKGRGAYVKYEVKWQGYDTTHNTWEAASQLAADCPELLKDYRKTNAKQRKKERDARKSNEAQSSIKTESALTTAGLSANEPIVITDETQNEGANSNQTPIPLPTTPVQPSAGGKGKTEVLVARGIAPHVCTLRSSLLKCSRRPFELLKPPKPCQETYEVEKVLRKRVVVQGPQYQVNSLICSSATIWP